MRKLIVLASLMFGILGVMSATIGPTTAFAKEMIKGEVQKVDEAAGTITLKHGPIKSLGMDQGMTMVFSIDPSALKGIKAGDKVIFQPERVNGQFTVTKIDKGS